MPAIAKLDELLRCMEPVLNAGRYAFATLPAGRVLDASLIISSMREPEGVSVVVALDVATQERLTPLFVRSWITLTVHSDLQAVGLTAAFASALGRAGISCNVVAGACHDHIFVPEHQADAAMAVLRGLQRNGLACRG
ncbi:MAG: ACT domain-containing protein [Rhodanobacter sp.]|jgi:hypothetical protein